MERVFTPIDTIAGMPIEKVKLYCEYDDIFLDELTANVFRFITSDYFVFYYIRNDNRQYIEDIDHMKSCYYTYTKKAVTWNETINYLLQHELYGMNQTKNKTSCDDRTIKGRFAVGNKCAYNAEIPLDLIIALYKLKMPVTQIARLLHVSRNTIYARINEYNKHPLPY